ncbi:MAG: NifU family protein [Nitrososphaerota archaeon]|jgi:Fe-S cluster biogenesis protein NfuA|nr:NifU family protein [Nitrososphaerota archaeon]
MSEEIKKRVQEALNDIRPQIQGDGGDVELVAVEGSVVKVRLVGHCACCPMSQATLKNGIETYVRERVSEIQKVESV